VIRLSTLLGLVGLAFATLLFIWEGLAPIANAFAAAGIGIVWASLFHFVSMAFNARAWQILLPGSGRGSLAFFFRAVWLREAVNGLLPVARVGGEVVSARFLMRHGMRSSKAVASLVVDMTISLVSQFVFTLCGFALLLFRGAGGDVVRDIAVGLTVTVPLVVVLIVVQRVGVFRLLARIVRVLFGDRFAALVGGAASLDRTVRRLYRRRTATNVCGALQLAGWIAGAGEIWLALHFLGHDVPAGDALIIEAVIQALSSGAFVVPGALGVQEGGFVVIGALVGLPSDIALALALARRARDIIVFVPALLAWQIGAGRRLIANA
jgi:putative membrane protein